MRVTPSNMCRTSKSTAQQADTASTLARCPAAGPSLECLLKEMARWLAQDVAKGQYFSTSPTPAQFIASTESGNPVAAHERLAPTDESTC